MAVKWGIMSTAHINRLFLAGARQSPEVEVVAVASRDGEAARRYAREHGIDRGHEGYDALLADPEVDVVYISLPNSLHLEWAVRALEAWLEASGITGGAIFRAVDRGGRLHRGALSDRTVARIVQRVAAADEVIE